MDLGTTLVSLSPFLMVVGIVGLVMWSVSANRRSVQETVREAIRSGQTLDADTIKALGAPQRKNDGNGDLKTGLILIAVAAAFVVLGFAIGQVEPGEADEAVPIMLAIAAFPGFIGAVLILFGLTSGRRKRDDATS